MPNHVLNVLTIDGDETLVKECMDAIKGGEKSQPHIDFNKIYRCPPELESSSSPAKVFDGSRAEYIQELNRCTRGAWSSSWNLTITTYPITREMCNTFMNDYGCADWYRWRIVYWGTKWNAYSQNFYDGEIEFETAWSTPEKAMIKLSQNYPTLRFTIKYCDEDFGRNLGMYVLENGEEVDGYYPEEGSSEAYEFGFQVKPDRREDFIMIDNEYVYQEMWGRDSLLDHLKTNNDVDFDKCKEMDNETLSVFIRELYSEDQVHYVVVD